MDALDLKAESRQVVKGHAKDLRRQGLIPAVVYGKDLDTEAIQIEARALERVLSVAGTHQLINLQVGDGKGQLTLARDVQRDTIRRHFLHVDFYAVKMDEKVHAQVPLEFEGEAPAVRELGGILTQGLDQLDVECLPSDLVASIAVNIDSLSELNDTVIVSDLIVPDTLTVLSDPDSMVAKIEAPRKVEELEALEEEELEVTEGEPEVITEAREDEADDSE